jgi:hypothetical protein
MGKFSRILLIVGLASVVGCIETKDEFIVNPDGSGKVTHELTFPAMNLEAGFQTMGGGAPGEMGGGKPPPEMAGGRPSDPQAQLKKSVREILSKSAGVDAWKDVSYKVTDDGRMYFKGTAYFPDINGLSIHSPNISSDMMRLSFTRNDLGEITIEIKGQEQPGAANAPQTALPAPAVPEEKLDELVRQAKVQYQQSRAMIQGVFSGLKVETILHLPGQIKEVSNFERIDDSTVRLAFDGAKTLQIMDRMMQNETWLKEQIRTGKDPMSSGPESDLMLNEMLFGQRAPIRVVVAGAAKPFFDYSTEAAAAKADYQSVLGQLGPGEEVSIKTPDKEKLPSEKEVGEITPPAPSEEETGMKVVVGGVRLVRLSDFVRGIMPLGQSNGYTLSLIAELPAPVVKVSGGKIEKAMTDTGKELLPKDQWSRKIRFPTLAGDGKTVVFDVELLLPDEGARGLEEVSGTLEYLTASGSREADLGVIAFEVGAKGDAYGAVVSSIEADPWQNNATMLGLRLDLPAEAIKSVEFYADGGAKLDISQRGSGSIGGTTTLKFSVRDQLPKSARVVLNVFDELKKDQIPFRIRNISLTGQPMR